MNKSAPRVYAKKTFYIRANEQTFERLKKISDANRRTLNNLINIILEDWVEEAEKMLKEKT